MNSTAKAILKWVLILVAAVGLYNAVEHSPNVSFKSLTFTEFMVKVDMHDVKEVEIAGSELKGRLSDGSRFETTIPADYPQLYSSLVQADVQVRIEPGPGSRSVPFTRGLPAWLLLVFWILWLSISAAILVVLIDVSRYLKRELRRPAAGR